MPHQAVTTLIGGAQREVRVMLVPAKLASRNLSPAGLIPMLRQANRQFTAGGLTSENREIVIETGAFLQSAEDVGDVVVGVFGGKPVYLREVAAIEDGAEEPVQYVLSGVGAAAGPGSVGVEEPAVTLSIAKRPGANAIAVAHDVLRKVASLQGRDIPGDVSVAITRNYGETAAEKSWMTTQSAALMHWSRYIFAAIFITLGVVQLARLVWK